MIVCKNYHKSVSLQKDDNKNTVINASRTIDTYQHGQINLSYAISEYTVHTGVVSYLCNKRGENVATKSWFNPRTSEHLLDPLFIELPDHQCSTQFSDSSGTLSSLIRKCLGIPPHLTHTSNDFIKKTAKNATLILLQKVIL